MLALFAFKLDILSKNTKWKNSENIHNDENYEE
jgi:hypothetical protein